MNTSPEAAIAGLLKYKDWIEGLAEEEIEANAEDARNGVHEVEKKPALLRDPKSAEILRDLINRLKESKSQFVRKDGDPKLLRNAFTVISTAVTMNYNEAQEHTPDALRKAGFEFDRKNPGSDNVARVVRRKLITDSSGKGAALVRELLESDTDTLIALSTLMSSLGLKIPEKGDIEPGKLED
jgi:hypothetical protein